MMRPPDRAVGAVAARGQLQFRSEGLQNSLPLRAHTGRHCELDFITHRRRNHRHSDARVSGSGLQDRFPRNQPAGSDSISEHVIRRTVFNRTARIGTLQLRHDPNSALPGIPKVDDLHQGGVADCIQYAHSLSPMLCFDKLSTNGVPIALSLTKGPIPAPLRGRIDGRSGRAASGGRFRPPSLSRQPV